MFAHSLPDIQIEAERVLRVVQRLPTQPTRPPAETLRIVQQWEENVSAFAEVIQEFDRIIAGLDALRPPEELQEEKRTLLATVRASRGQAFRTMVDLNPEEAWFWTEEWQRGQRQAEAEVAESANGPNCFSDEEYVTALREYIAQGAPFGKHPNRIYLTNEDFDAALRARMHDADV